MKIHNPIYFYLLAIFTLVNIVDAVTAFFILPGEANPLYLLTGSIWPIIIAKAIIIYGFWFYHKRNIFRGHFMYYYLLSLLVFGSLLMMMGAASNIHGILNPDAVTSVAGITPKEKASAYATFISIVLLIPMLLNFLIFWLYDKSIKNVVFDKEFYKKRKWKL